MPIVMSFEKKDPEVIRSNNGDDSPEQKKPKVISENSVPVDISAAKSAGLSLYSKMGPLSSFYTSLPPKTNQPNFPSSAGQRTSLNIELTREEKRFQLIVFRDIIGKDVETKEMLKTLCAKSVALEEKWVEFCKEIYHDPDFNFKTALATILGNMNIKRRAAAVQELDNIFKVMSEGEFILSPTSLHYIAHTMINVDLQYNKSCSQEGDDHALKLFTAMLYCGYRGEKRGSVIKDVCEKLIGSNDKFRENAINYYNSNKQVARSDYIKDLGVVLGIEKSQSIKPATEDRPFLRNTLTRRRRNTLPPSSSSNVISRRKTLPPSNNTMNKVVVAGDVQIVNLRQEKGPGSRINQGNPSGPSQSI